MQFIVKLIIFLVIVFAFSYILNSQQFSDPLKPKVFSEKNLGLAVGIGGNFQRNTLLSEKCNCLFDDGRGLSFVLKAFYEYKISYPIWVGININYYAKNFSALFRKYENLMVHSEILDHSEQVNLEMKHTADINLSYLGLSPTFKLFFFDFLNFTFGLNAQYNIYSNIFHQKEILTQSVTLTTGEKLNPKFEDTNSKIITIEDNSFQNIRKLIFSMNFEIGTSIRLSNLYSLGFSLEYSYMLNPVTNDENKFYVNSLNFLISFIFTSRQNTSK